MQPYQSQLKPLSRALRSNMTEAEQKLWHLLRRKQIQGLQFYRQKPLLNYIVDFYCPQAKLVIEIDGSQHFEEHALKQDQIRTEALSALGLTLIRFDNRQVLLETNEVLEQIVQTIQQQIPPRPPLIKGGIPSAEDVLAADQNNKPRTENTHPLPSEPNTHPLPSEPNTPPLEKGGQGGFATKEKNNNG